MVNNRKCVSMSLSRSNYYIAKVNRIIKHYYKLWLFQDSYYIVYKKEVLKSSGSLSPHVYGDTTYMAKIREFNAGYVIQIYGSCNELAYSCKISSPKSKFCADRVADFCLTNSSLSSAVIVGECETKTSHRRRGLYKYSLEHIIENGLPLKGHYSALISSSINNIGSNRGIKSAGFLPFARVRRTRIIGIDFFKLVECNAL